MFWVSQHTGGKKFLVKVKVMIWLGKRVLRIETCRTINYMTMTSRVPDVKQMTYRCLISSSKSSLPSWSSDEFGGLNPFVAADATDVLPLASIPNIFPSSAGKRNFQNRQLFVYELWTSPSFKLLQGRCSIDWLFNLRGKAHQSQPVPTSTHLNKLWSSFRPDFHTSEISSRMQSISCYRQVRSQLSVSFNIASQALFCQVPPSLKDPALIANTVCILQACNFYRWAGCLFSDRWGCKWWRSTITTGP